MYILSLTVLRLPPLKCPVPCAQVSDTNYIIITLGNPYSTQLKNDGQAAARFEEV